VLQTVDLDFAGECGGAFRADRCVHVHGDYVFACNLKTRANGAEVCSIYGPP
jgi:hypothetical protein